MEPEPSSLSSSLQSLPIDNGQTKNEKFKITLNSPDNSYYSGQTVRGTVTINCSKPKRIRGIYFKIFGYGKCSWTDLFGQNTEKSNNSSIKYSGSEEYLNSTVYIIGAKNGRVFDLPEGTTTYDFSYELKTVLPSSFTGTYGKIKYKMEFVIDKPWKFDEKQTVLLNIIQFADLNHVSNALQSVEKLLTRNIGYIGSGPISLHVFIPKSAYVPNERMPVQLVITNNSRTPVDKVKFSIHKIVEYHSLAPVTVSKREVVKILKKEAGGVHKKTEQRYEHVIDIPYLMPSDELSPSRIIHIKYEIKVEAKISGMFRNLIISIPLIVGSMPNDGALSATARPLTNITSSAAIPASIYPHMPVGFHMNRLSLDSDSADTITSQSGQNVPISPSSSVVSMPSSITPSITSPLHSTELPNRHHPNTSTVQPTAPPLELCSDVPISSTHSTSIRMDAPPTYDQVFGSPSSVTSSNRSSVYQITTSPLNSTASSNVGKA